MGRNFIFRFFSPLRKMKSNDYHFMKFHITFLVKENISQLTSHQKQNEISVQILRKKGCTPLFFNFYFVLFSFLPPGLLGRIRLHKRNRQRRRHNPHRSIVFTISAGECYSSISTFELFPRSDDNNR